MKITVKYKIFEALFKGEKIYLIKKKFFLNNKISLTWWLPEFKMVGPEGEYSKVYYETHKGAEDEILRLLEIKLKRQSRVKLTKAYEREYYREGEYSSYKSQTS